MKKIQFNLALGLCIYFFFTLYYYSADASDPLLVKQLTDDNSNIIINDELDIIIEDIIINVIEDIIINDDSDLMHTYSKSLKFALQTKFLEIWEGDSALAKNMRETAELKVKETAELKAAESLVKETVESLAKNMKKKSLVHLKDTVESLVKKTVESVELKDDVAKAKAKAKDDVVQMYAEMFKDCSIRQHAETFKNDKKLVTKINEKKQLLDQIITRSKELEKIINNNLLKTTKDKKLVQNLLAAHSEQTTNIQSALEEALEERKKEITKLFQSVFPEEEKEEAEEKEAKEAKDKLVKNLLRTNMKNVLEKVTEDRTQEIKRLCQDVNLTFAEENLRNIILSFKNYLANKNKL